MVTIHATSEPQEKKQPLYTIKATLDNGAEVISCRHAFWLSNADSVIPAVWREGITADRLEWFPPHRIRHIDIIEKQEA